MKKKTPTAQKITRTYRLEPEVWEDLQKYQENPLAPNETKIVNAALRRFLAAEMTQSGARR